MSKSDFSVTNQPLQLDRPVRITLPARAAYDLKAMQNVLASLGERLGCAKCMSGANCLFELERDFRVDEKLDVIPRNQF